MVGMGRGRLGIRSRLKMTMRMKGGGRWGNVGLWIFISELGIFLER